MANYDGFEKASYYGNKGERAAIELLERNGFTTQDVSTNPNFFTAGDIIATRIIQRKSTKSDRMVYSFA